MLPSHEAALRVECPACHALPGDRCRNYHGQGCAPHRQRLAAGREAPAVEPQPEATPARPAEQLNLMGGRRA